MYKKFFFCQIALSDYLGTTNSSHFTAQLVPRTFSKPLKNCDNIPVIYSTPSIVLRLCPFRKRPWWRQSCRCSSCTARWRSTCPPPRCRSGSPPSALIARATGCGAVRFDFVIDEDLKVYLMEANMSPNLSSAHFPANARLYE